MIEIEIDKLTNSIEEVATGKVLETVVLPIAAADWKVVTKKNQWQFDWRKESRQPGHSVYKLVARAAPTVIHGLVSLEVRSDHVRLHLVESAPVNKGKLKNYLGVAGNLFAYACKLAYEHGHQGRLTALCLGLAEGR